MEDGPNSFILRLLDMEQSYDGYNLVKKEPNIWVY